MDTNVNDKKIKNVIIINDFNYVQGGASKVAIDTANILKNEGFNVIFFCGVYKNENAIEGIEYISTSQCEALKDKNILRGAINGVYNFKVRRILKTLLEKMDQSETIIHVHGWTKVLSSSVFDIAFKMKFKVVLTLHDYFSACPNGGFFNYKENNVCKLKPLSFKCIKCNCDSRNYFFKMYRIIRQIVQNKVVKVNEKIGNVITISDFSERILNPTISSSVKRYRLFNPIEEVKSDSNGSYNKKGGYYLYVGRISKEKGVDIFCSAIHQLNLKGIVVGDGNEKERLMKEYTDIEFTGWKRKDEVIEYMKNAEALVFPSRWYETAGLTVLEALSCETPCIVYKNCAASEFIEDGVDGLVFESIEQLKSSIGKLKHLKVDKRKVEKYSIEKYKNKLIEIYNSI